MNIFLELLILIFNFLGYVMGIIFIVGRQNVMKEY
ncbi:MAG: hypothetical protein A4E26_01256 [Methanobacterium sp. PtaU1.Bin097]|jgi:predicted membrane protein|nr:MAG: hypothetical protein A4E26_01256 [Methanobacterium sp. PtaU1.Bin097]